MKFWGDPFGINLSKCGFIVVVVVAIVVITIVVVVFIIIIIIVCLLRDPVDFVQRQKCDFPRT